MYNLIIIQTERVEDLDNEKDTPKTINDMVNNSDEPQPVPPQPKLPLTFNENDPIEVNNLLTLANSDITPDLLAQLESRAKEEQKKMELAEGKTEELDKQEDIQIQEGLPAENGAVNVTADILERPKDPPKETTKEEEQPPQPLSIFNPLPEKQPEQEETLDPLEEAKMNAVYKKYVIYINHENEPFLDSLTLAERKKLINDVLEEQNRLSEEQRAEKQRIERTTKLIISIVTFIITVPIIYLLFNVSLEATIQNYRHSKTNFEVLYKETGKIKIKQ